MKDVNEILRDYASDMLGVEKHILEVLEKQTGDDRMKAHREAYDLLVHVQSTLNSHILSLERYLSSIDGGFESPVKKAATKFMGAMTGIYDKLRFEDTISRNLRDDFTSLNLAAISYTMLHTTARSLGDEKLSELSLEHLNQLTPFIAKISALIPRIVASELFVEGKAFDASIAEEAMQDTRRAWSCEILEKMEA